MSQNELAGTSAARRPGMPPKCCTRVLTYRETAVLTFFLDAGTSPITFVAPEARMHAQVPLSRLSRRGDVRPETLRDEASSRHRMVFGNPPELRRRTTWTNKSEHAFRCAYSSATATSVAAISSA